MQTKTNTTSDLEMLIHMQLFRYVTLNKVLCFQINMYVTSFFLQLNQCKRLCVKQSVLGCNSYTYGNPTAVTFLHAVDLPYPHAYIPLCVSAGVSIPVYVWVVPVVLMVFIIIAVAALMATCCITVHKYDNRQLFRRWHHVFLEVRLMLCQNVNCYLSA